MKKIYFIIALIAGTSFSSCEDFLNQVPEHELVQENAVIDYNSAKNIVNGMYSNYASSKTWEVIYTATCTCKLESIKQEENLPKPFII